MDFPVPNGQIPRHFSPPAGALSLGRNELFAGLLAAGFCNGISEIVVASWMATGPGVAVLNAFDISVIVWGALIIGLVLLLRDRTTPIRSMDLAVAIAISLAFLVPIPSLSWLGIEAMAIYLLRSALPASPTARGAAILLALTIPMFWARLLMASLGNIVLDLDATLVSWFLGTTRDGNVVPFADGSGAIWIAPGCSSFTNVSLAILCTVALTKAYNRPWSPRILSFGVLACLGVIAINVVRIGLIGLYPAQFELIHGAVGSTVAGWLTTAVILGLCAYGIGRDAPAAA